MKKIFASVCMMFLLVGLNSSVSALIIFQDDFNSEHGGSAVLNYGGFSNWDVTGGTVDLIGNGKWDFQPGNGLYVDLDGSTRNAGQLTSVLFLEAGDYLLSFDLAGNHRNNAGESVNVAVGLGLFSASYSLLKNDPFQTFNEYISVATAGNYNLSFEGTGNDNIGMLLDNVMLETVPAPTPTPEPATMLLLGTGLVGLAGTMRKRKQ